MENKIVWQKWVDPFLTNEDDVDPNTDSMSDEPVGYKDSYQQAEEKKHPTKINSGPVIVGPMGIIPLNEHNAPGKVFCFWLGHTNFNISTKVKNILKKIVGVETLDIFTRYRFRVAVGKAFLDEAKDPYGKNILLNIEKILCPKQKAKKKPTFKEHTINILKKKLDSTGKFWAILEAEDGSLDPRKAATKEEVIKLIEESRCNVLAKSWE